MEKREPSYTVGMNAHWYSHYGEEYGDSLEKLEIELPYDPAIPLLGIHSEETRIQRDTCTPMYIAALFTTARTWKRRRCPSTDEQIKKLWYIYTTEYSVQFNSVTQSCLTLYDPMNHRTPGLPVHHQLPEFTATHVHRVSDAIWYLAPSGVPFSSCPQSLPASESFPRVNSSHGVAKVLEFQLQHHSFQRNPRADLLQNGLVESPCSPRDSQEFSNTTVQKHQFSGTQLSSQSNSHIHT